MSHPGKTTPLSPTWKRPTDLMKKRSRRSSTNHSSPSIPLRPFNKSPSPSKRDPQYSPARKRRNPFSCSPNRKKLNLGPDLEVSTDSDFILFQMLNKSETPISPRVESKLNTKAVASPLDLDKIDPANVIHLEVDMKEVEVADDGLKLLPIDWSLKTKVRFLSTESFSWIAPMKTQDEAQGVAMFVRESDKLPRDYTNHSTNQTSSIVNETDNQTGSYGNDGYYSNQSELKSAAMYWMHPNLPWLNLFPRQVSSESRIGKPSEVVLDDYMIQQLHRDWCQSFSSLFNLLKTNLCPYFYVLTHQFSVLFRCAGVSSNSVNALLTPTTRGFRESLSNDGIEFSLPLFEKSLAVSASSSRATSQEDEIQTTDTGASNFLESIGVDKQKFPELQPEKVKLEREDYKRIDSRPESTILVQNDETKSLFNYLLNCRSCIAQTGIARGIPPTLLAPVAFNGSTLKSLLLKSGGVRQADSKGLPVKMFSLEITGPLLPDCVARLAALVARVHKSFTGSLSTHEPTVTFNEVRTCEAKCFYSNTDKDNETNFLSEEREACQALRSFQFKADRYHITN